jgi:putative redox protein
MSRSVTVTSGSLRFVQNISVGPHVLKADEPHEHGGADAGPDPHELLLGALGACAAITVQMYADRKQWPLEGVHIDLSYVQVPAEDRADSGARSEMVDGIEMGISFSGGLSEGRERRLLEVAGKCPIHRLLTSPVSIQAKLLAPGSLPT